LGAKTLHFFTSSNGSTLATADRNVGMQRGKSLNNIIIKLIMIFDHKIGVSSEAKQSVAMMASCSREW
jgi:hypothetical protein